MAVPLPTVTMPAFKIVRKELTEAECQHMCFSSWSRALDQLLNSRLSFLLSLSPTRKTQNAKTESPKKKNTEEKLILEGVLKT